jgi:hypothetical protein
MSSPSRACRLLLAAWLTVAPRAALAEARADDGRPAATLVACSFDEAVCVHALSGAPARAVTSAFAAAERALAGLRALDLPAPLPDGKLGGSPALDLYVAAGPGGGAARRDPESYRVGLDRTSAHAVVLASSDPDCRLDSDVARSVSQAALYGLDAGLGDAILGMHASYLASLLAPCGPLELAAVDRFQRAPERALASSGRHEFAGESLFPWFLDDAFGAGRIAVVMTSLIAAGAQHTPHSAGPWRDEPDVFDVLGRILPERDLTLGDLLLDFAVARAFVGDRSDGAHLLGSERYGSLGRVRFEWAIEQRSLPRRLAPQLPVEATGATYVWLSLDENPSARPARLLISARSEESFVFQWAAVRVDAEGRELGRVGRGGVWGRDRIDLTVESLHDAAGLLIVGTNLGGDDRSVPYDPDAPPGAAGYELSIFRE